MALAGASDVEAALGRDLVAVELNRVESLLDEASDLVAGYLHPCTVPVPVPGAIKRVVASMVAAVFSRPVEIPVESESLNMGPYGVKFGAGTTSVGPYFTAALKSRLAPYRCGSGMVSVQLGSERF